MWNMQTLLNETLPENWTVVQTFTTVNAQTFQMCIVNNMKSLDDGSILKCQIW